MDVLAKETSIYLYDFKDRIIREYGFDGKERKKIPAGGSYSWAGHEEVNV